LPDFFDLAEKQQSGGEESRAKKKNFLPQPEQEAHTQYTFRFPSNGLWPGG